MPQYAYFDHTAAAPAPVLGWYDTDVAEHKNLPASADLLALTPAQWAARSTQRWAVSGGALVAYAAPTLPTAAPAVTAVPAPAVPSVAELLDELTTLRAQVGQLHVS